MQPGFAFARENLEQRVALSSGPAASFHDAGVEDIPSQRALERRQSVRFAAINCSEFCTHSAGPASHQDHRPGHCAHPCQRCTAQYQRSQPASATPVGTDGEPQIRDNGTGRDIVPLCPARRSRKRDGTWTHTVGVSCPVPISRPSVLIF